MGLLDGKRGLVFGVANDRSIANHIALSLKAEGATCGFTYLPGEKNERRVRKALEEGGMADAWVYPCDASNDAELDAAFAAAREKFDTLDFLIHSIAYADRAYLKHGMFAETPRAVFAQALDISAYSLVAMCKRARDLMPRGGVGMLVCFRGNGIAVSL